MTVNEKGHLEIGGCDAVELAARFGTPLYVFNETVIRENCRYYQEAFGKAYPDSTILYAGKSFLTLALCRVIDQEGLGLDVVSGGEVYTALAAGFPPRKMYFHGNNKSRAEMEMALQAGVGRFIVDSLAELELLNETASALGKEADILLRITLDVDTDTHSYLDTARHDSKFGLALSTGQAIAAVGKAAGLPNIRLRGLHCHIGSQIMDYSPFRLAAATMMDFIAEIKGALGLDIEELDLGGGLGVRYINRDKAPIIADYAEALAAVVRGKAEEHDLLMPHLLVEPGRSIIAESGITLYTVGTIKEIPGIRTYAAVDGGMADNPRVALYQAVYESDIANKAGRPAESIVSIAGKCCESGDMLIWDAALPEVAAGDILALYCTGAYHHSMASNYNRLPRPAVVFIRDGQPYEVVARESYEDLIRRERIPAYLNEEQRLPTTY